MAFCPKCGTEITNEAGYCSSCGTQLAAETSVLDSELRAADRRTELANAIYALLQKFSSTKNQYDRLGQLNEIAARENVTQGGCLLALVWMWAGFHWLIAVLGIDSLINPSPDKQVIPGGIVTIAIFFLIGAIMPLLSFLAKRHRKKKAANARIEMGKIYNSLYQYWQSVPNNPVAFEYSDPYSLQAIYGILQNGKANDIRGAILVLDNERYQSSMLNLQGSILEEARNARDAASAAAGAATAAAVFSGIAAIRR